MVDASTKFPPLSTIDDIFDHYDYQLACCDTYDAASEPPGILNPNTIVTSRPLAILAIFVFLKFVSNPQRPPVVEPRYTRHPRIPRIPCRSLDIFGFLKYWRRCRRLSTFLPCSNSSSNFDIPAILEFLELVAEPPRPRHPSPPSNSSSVFDMLSRHTNRHHHPRDSSNFSSNLTCSRPPVP